MLRLLFLFSAILCSQLVISQGLINSKTTSPEKLIFKISSAQAKRIIDSGFPKDVKSLLKEPFDTILESRNAEQEIEEAGHYVVLAMDANNLSKRYVQIVPFSIRVLDEDYEPKFILFDKKGRSIKNAMFSFKGEKISFNSTLGAYVYSKYKKGKPFTISLEDQVYFLNLNGSYSWKNNETKVLNDFRKENFGYLAFSQPKYRYGDTVKMKAFAVRNNMPCTDDLTVTLGVPHDRNFKTRKIGIIKADSLGSYQMEFVLGDTIPLNRNVKITLSWSKGGEKLSIYNEFYLEDYQLDETFYSIKAKSFYKSDAPVEILLKGVNANGNPLQDIEFTATVLPLHIHEAYRKVDYLNFKPLIIEDKLNKEGEFKLTLDSLTKTLNVKYRVVVTFSNSEGEVQSEIKSFAVGPFLSKLIGGNLNKPLFLFKDLGTSFSWQLLDTNYINKKISLFTVQKSGDTLINSVNNFGEKQYAILDQEYLFEWDGELASFEVPYSSKVDYLSDRTADSLTLEMANPRGLNVNYALYKDKKRIKEGRGKSLSLNLKTDSQDEYNLLLEFVCKGQVNSRIIPLNLVTRELKLTTDLPDEVSPGDVVSVKVKITDFEDKPVTDVNVLASSVNNKFAESQLPYAIDNEQQYTGPRVRKRNVSDRDGKTGKKLASRVKEDWFTGDSLAYYQFVYSKKPVVSIVDTLSYNDPAQFAVHAFDNGKQVGIMYILVNGAPVYFAGSEDAKKYSFTQEPGVYTIQIRTKDFLYTIDNVKLKQGQKLSLGIHEDLYVKDETFSREKRKKSLRKQEAELIFSKLFLIHNTSYSTYMNLKQGYKEYEVRAYENRFVVGPFDSSKVVGVEYRRDNTSLKLYKGEKLRIKKGDSWLRYKNLGLFEFGRFVKGKKKDSKVNLMFDFIPSKKRIKKPRYEVKSWNDEKLDLRFGGLCLNFKGELKPLYYTFEYSNVKYATGYGIILLKGGEVSVNLYYEGGEKVLISNISIYKEQITLLTIWDEQTIGFKNLESDSTFIKTRFWYGADLNYKNNIEASKRRLESAKVGYSHFSLYKTPIHFYPTVSNVSLVGRYNLLNSDGDIYNKKFSGSGFSLGVEFPLYNTNSRRSYHYKAEQKDLFHPLLGVGYSYNVLRGDDSNASSNSVEKSRGDNFETRMHSIDLSLSQGFRFPVAEKLTFHLNLSVGSSYLFYDPVVESNQPLESYRKSALAFPLGAEVSIPLDFMHKYFWDVFGGYKYTFTTSDYLDGITGNGRNDRFSSITFGIRFTIPKARHFACASRFWGGEDVSSERGLSNKNTSIVPSGTFHMGQADENVSSSGFVSRGSPSDGLVYPSDPSEEETEDKVINIRSDFKDTGFWVPTIYTDDEGNASFKVQFPEDITSWRTYIMAMKSTGQMGVLNDTILSYRPFYVELMTPRFMLEGDSTNLVAKITNLNADSLTYEHQFSVDDQLKSRGIQTINLFEKEGVSVVATNSDSIEVRYTVQSKELSDGEQKLIPVLPVGMEATLGEFLVLDGDTSASYATPTGLGEVTINIEDNLLNVLLDEIDKVQAYAYGCNEQLASKMSLLLSKKLIYEKMNKKLSGKDERAIKRMIYKLVQNQNEEGGWSWWGNSKSNYYMSTYTTHALNRAYEEFGYDVKGLDRAKRYLGGRVKLRTGENYFLPLVLQLAEMKIELNYDEAVRQARPLNDGLQNQLYKTRIAQVLGKTTSVDYILKEKKETFKGGNYWGDGRNVWHSNRITSTLLVYEILRSAKVYGTDLGKIQDFLLERRKVQWRNTAESAKIVEIIISDLTYEPNQEPTKVTVSGAVDYTFTEFPVQFKTDSTGTFEVKKTGKGKSYLCISQSYFDPKPKVRTVDFSVQTYFEQDKKRVDTLTSGEPLYLIANIDAKKSGDFIMIEVPIPAGCSYDKDKRMGENEIHREYRKEKVVVFYDFLPQGKHQVKIKLQPRYKGQYSINPTKAELMYFPVFYGNNEIRKVEIR